MSSGNYASKAGFNESGFGIRLYRCPAAWLETAINIAPDGELEPRGPLATCQVCGSLTSGRDAAGMPRHPRIVPVA